MIRRAEEMETMEELCPENGKGLIKVIKPSEYYDKHEKLSFFALAKLEPGAEVGYHVHVGESEMYYILSGEGEFNDNGTIVPIKPGDVTFTPNGEGHSIKNTGTQELVFNAMIVYD